MQHQPSSYGVNSEAPLPAVSYGAKSTEDRHESIRTQLAEARAMAEREGFVVLATYCDEGFSAYTRNRGPASSEPSRGAAAAAAESGAAGTPRSTPTDSPEEPVTYPRWPIISPKVTFWVRRHGCHSALR